MFAFIGTIMQMFICFGLLFFGILLGNWFIHQLDKRA